MPTIRVNGAQLYYEDHGSGGEAVLFAHGLAFDHRMWEAPVDSLKGRYRCVTFDCRGQGLSEVTANGYDMDTLAEDAASLIAALDLSPCHFVGLSMGGFIGLRLAIRYPELLRSITIMNSSAEPEPAASRRRYTVLRVVARWLGLRPVLGRLMPIMFGGGFLDDPARRDEAVRWRERMGQNDRVGISRAARGVIDRQGVADRLGDIRLPALIVAGESDLATPPKLSRTMHEAIPDSRLEVLPGAGHMSVLEQPDRVTALIESFLGGAPKRPPAET